MEISRTGTQVTDAAASGISPNLTASVEEKVNPPSGFEATRRRRLDAAALKQAWLVNDALDRNLSVH